MSVRPCPECQGSRLRPESRAVRVGGMAIHEFTALSARRALQWVDELELSETDRAIARLILREIDERLRFLDDVGIGYLSMDRAAATLSGGEAQRIRLATQIGSALVGVLYVLDEPSIGLHQRDNAQADRDARAPARPRQHGARRRARRGDDARRRPPRRHRPGRGRARRPRRRAGHGRRRSSAVPESLTGQFLSGTRRDRGAGAAAQAERLRRDRGRAPAQPQERRRQGAARRRSAASPACRARASRRSSTRSSTRRWPTGCTARKLRPGAHQRVRGLEQLDKII